jgi:acetyl esterase
MLARSLGSDTIHHGDDTRMTYPIDPELTPILELIPSLGIKDPVTARSGFNELVGMMNAELDTSGVDISEREIDGLNGAPPLMLRIYSPSGLATTVPGLLYIHGGGFVIGTVDSEEGRCLSLCRELGIVVVSVDYRLSPETPFPGPLEDCYAGLCWTHDNANTLQLDTRRLGVFGLSAGGGLAAATALMARDDNGPAICFQYLGIPEVDDRLTTQSMKKFVDTPMWNKPNAELSWDYYLGDAYRRGADDVPYLAAPARLEDASGLPPAYINTMEFDPLRDEGVLYAMTLMKAGVSTELHSYPGTFHGSSMVPNAAVSQREAEEMFAVLRRGLCIDSSIGSIKALLRADTLADSVDRGC